MELIQEAVEVVTKLNKELEAGDVDRWVVRFAVETDGINVSVKFGPLKVWSSVTHPFIEPGEGSLEELVRKITEEWIGGIQNVRLEK